MPIPACTPSRPATEEASYAATHGASSVVETISPFAPAGKPSVTPGTLRFRGGATVRVVDHGRGTLVVSIRGELDVYDRYSIIDIFFGFVLDGIRWIVIDASELTFIDGSALRSFARINRCLVGRGGWLTLVGASPRIEFVWSRIAAASPIGSTPRDADGEARQHSASIRFAGMRDGTRAQHRSGN